MHNVTKKIAIIATAMIGLGIILIIIGGLAGGMGPIHFGKNGFSIGYEEGTILKDLKTERKSLNEFSDVDVNVDLYDIEFVPGNEYAVEYTYNKNIKKPIISANGKSLTISQNEHINGINLLDGLNLLKGFSSPSIKIYYPKNASFDHIRIQNNAGDIQIDYAIAKKIDLELDLGDASLSNVTTDHLGISISAGDCNLTDVIASKGDISSDLGNLSTRNFSAKGLEIENNAGDINLQGNFTGKNKIEADMGDVEVTTTLPEKDYNYNVKVDLGDFKINGARTSPLVKSNGASNHIEIESSAGDVKLNFQ